MDRNSSTSGIAMYGTAATMSSTTALQLLQEAFAYIPFEDKIGLMEAIRTAPQCVLQESNPAKFLQIFSANPWVAAQRLCRYWNERLRVFGTQRAFLPLELSTDDLRKLQQQPNLAVVRLLPKDVNGGSVLWYDTAHMMNESQKTNDNSNNNTSGPSNGSSSTGEDLASAACQCRILFFLLQQMMNNLVSQADGCSCVLRMDLNASVIDPLQTELGKWLVNVFPLRVKAFHVVVRLPPGLAAVKELWNQSSSTLPTAVARWEVVLRLSAVLHVQSDESSILTSLRKQGIVLDSLPPRVPAENGTKPSSVPGTLTTGDATSNHSIQQPTATNDSLSTTLPTVMSQPPIDTSQRRETMSNSQISVSSFQDDGTMRQQGLAQLYEAVSFLPDHQKAAYLEAQRVCPELVQTESDPLKFLRFHQYNAWSAARRITTYWTKRKQIFGERAFLPMTMTGDGAMNQEDIIFLRTGYFCILPKDRHGRMVICYDPSRRVDHAKEARMRIGFYFWSIICEHETSITDGYVGIVLLGNGSFGVASLDGAIRECVDIVIDCFPTRSRNIHLVQTIRPSGARRSLLQMLLPLILQVMGRILENDGVTHVSESKGEMAKEFESFGLNPSGLPTSAGGTWTYDEFYRWQLERCRLERQRCQLLQQTQRLPPERAASTSSGIARAMPPTAVPSMFQSAIPNLSLSLGASALQDTSFLRSQHQDDSSMQMDYIVRRLSPGERTAYVEACARVPNLVKDESPTSWFVSHASGDVREAARRLASYWTLRQRLFGDRAFLPMAQTGEGALGRKDLNLLNSGFFSVLPTRQAERVILSYDCARDDLSDEGGRLRVAFYVISLAAEREVSRKSGICLVASGLPEIAKLQQEGGLNETATFRTLLEVLPVSVYAIHIVMLLQPNAPAFPLDESVQGMRRLFGSAGPSKAMVHVGTSRDEITQQLAPYGIDQSILPKHLGGSFGYDRFTQWQELRIRYEWCLPAGANDQDALEIYDFSHKVTPLSAMSEEEKKERKRRMNVVHSRRKRERERIEIEVLQEQCDELKDRQVVLTEENEKLTNLLQRARELVSSPIDGGDCKPAPNK